MSYLIQKHQPGNKIFIQPSPELLEYMNQQKLVPYGTKLLRNPASKILSTTGGLYLGSQMFNNNN